MEITASILTDPTMRDELQQYYESKKAKAIESWKTREPFVGEVKMLNEDGSYETATLIPIEKLKLSFASFDEWLNFQVESFDNSGFGPKSMEMAEKMLSHVQKETPDSSSNVRSTFSNDGVLLAYVNTDGSILTTNGSERILNPIIEKANDLGLSGQERVNYLSREAKAALSKNYKGLNVVTYNNSNIPTKREFADIWYDNFDIDQNYRDMMTQAQEQYDSVNEWFQQWQKNMNEMRDYLLTLQEAA